MPLRNKEYGKAEPCEYDTCERARGAPLRSVYSYGCVLCTFHENEYQKGNISLPDSASESRKQQAAVKVLG